MSFIIPNVADAGDSKQAQVDKVDLDILVAGLKGDGVIVGCAVTAQGSPNMTVAVAAGLVLINNASLVVSAGNVTIATANATNPRFDLICVDNAGAKSAVAGTAAASPVFPAIPSNSSVLAAVYVPANDTTIASDQIVDKRVVVPAEVSRCKSADETISSDATLNNDNTLFFDADANSIWEVEVSLLLNAPNTTADWLFGWAGPASATMAWGPPFVFASALGSHSYFWTAPQVASGAQDALLAIGGTLSIGSTVGVMGLHLKGILQVASTAGTVNFKWSQNTSNANNSTVKKGSFLKARRIG